MKRIFGLTILAIGIALYVASMFLRVSPGENLFGWQCFLYAFRELPDAIMVSGDWSGTVLYVLSDYSNAVTLLCLLPLGKVVQRTLSVSLLVSAPSAVLWLYFAPGAHASISVAPILWGFSMMLVSLGVYSYVHHDDA
jgi:hypothetical protein